MQPVPPPITASEVRIVDAKGQARLVLAAPPEGPNVRLLTPDGQSRAELSLDAAGRPTLKLSSPAPAQPAVALEIDDKGAHVKFDRPAGGSSYLFLNNAGATGVVLIDVKGVRRLQAALGSDGEPRVRRFDAAGHAIP